MQTCLFKHIRYLKLFRKLLFLDKTLLQLRQLSISTDTNIFNLQNFILVTDRNGHQYS